MATNSPRLPHEMMKHPCFFLISPASLQDPNNHVWQPFCRSREVHFRGAGATGTTVRDGRSLMTIQKL